MSLDSWVLLKKNGFAIEVFHLTIKSTGEKNAFRYNVTKDYKWIPLYISHDFKEYIPTVFCRTILLAFSVPGEPVVVALLCLIGAWPGWSRLHPLENDLSTETFWNSCPTPRNADLQS